MKFKTEPLEHYLYISISGVYEDNFEGVSSLRQYAEICKEHNLDAILIDARKIEGEVSTMAEFGRGLEFATAFKDNNIQIAIVGTEEYLTRESLFETVARNRKVPLRVFTDIDQAEQWLIKRLSS